MCYELSSDEPGRGGEWMRRLVVLSAVVTVGCAIAAPPPEIPVQGSVPGRLCSGERLGAFAGRQATAELGSEILAASGAARLRWLPHGAIITMEYEESRVTVRLDPDNRVTSARCG